MITPLKIAICEDTKADSDALLALLEKVDPGAQCTLFQSGEELLAAFRPQTFDLLLSDIYMSGLNGIETVSKIRELDAELPVAFITTSTDFALESYRLSALKYIEKPFNEKDVRDAVRLARLERDSAPSITIRKNGREERLRLSQILYIEQQMRLLSICLTDGVTVQVYEKLSLFLPQLLEYGFFMPHKSFAVNLAFVKFIDAELRCFIMQSGKNIPIRRESMGAAKQALRDYLFSRTREGVPL